MFYRIEKFEAQRSKISGGYCLNTNCKDVLKSYKIILNTLNNK